MCTAECGCGGRTCSGCCVCSGCSCVPGSCPACKSCVDCLCECTSECCEDSDCDQANCYHCVDCNCEYQCDPDNCQNCDGQGTCEDRCVLFHNCLECDGEGSCVSRCNPSQCCYQDSCVDKCTNTGQCDYGTLPGGPYPNCQALQDPITGRCDGAEGFLCGHAIAISVNGAECADCEPSCAKTRICACAQINPVYCQTRCVYIIVCGCFCENVGEPEYRGDHYECD
ncbi:hypothetical protein ES703_84336 [subsurface metagenome]